MSNIRVPYDLMENNIQQSLTKLENLSNVISQIDKDFASVVEMNCWEGTLRNAYAAKYIELAKCVNSIGLFNLEQSVYSKILTVDDFMNAESQSSSQYGGF